MFYQVRKILHLLWNIFGVYCCNISKRTEYFGAYVQFFPEFSNDECYWIRRWWFSVRLCKYWLLVYEICFIRFEKSYIFFEISLGVYRCNISLQTEYVGAYLQIIPRFSNDECCRFRRFHIFFVVVSESGSLFNSNDVNSIHNRISAIFLFTDLKLSTNYVVQITIATTLFV